jgi:hypothetical protein
MNTHQGSHRGSKVALRLLAEINQPHWLFKPSYTTACTADIGKMAVLPSTVNIIFDSFESHARVK